MIVAFATTVGLAQWTISYRHVGSEQVLPGWPITFKLPEPYHWTRAATAPEMQELGHGVDGETVAYRGHAPKLGHCIVQITCERDSGARDSGGGLLSLFNLQETIRIGPIEGHVTETRMEDGAILQAEGVGDGGLRIIVTVVGESSARRLRTVLTNVCHSVRLVPTSGRSAAQTE